MTTEKTCKQCKYYKKIDDFSFSCESEVYRGYQICGKFDKIEIGITTDRMLELMPECFQLVQISKYNWEIEDREAEITVSTGTTANAALLEAHRNSWQIPVDMEPDEPNRDI